MINCTFCGSDQKDLLSHEVLYGLQELAMLKGLQEGDGLFESTHETETKLQSYLLLSS